MVYVCLLLNNICLHCASKSQYFSIVKWQNATCVSWLRICWNRIYLQSYMKRYWETEMSISRDNSKLKMSTISVYLLQYLFMDTKLMMLVRNDLWHCIVKMLFCWLLSRWTIHHSGQSGSTISWNNCIGWSEAMVLESSVSICFI